VALANKLARIAWSVLRNDRAFDTHLEVAGMQDEHGNGRDWRFKTSEHGGDEPDNMPQAITATDPQGRWAVYVPFTRGGKLVVLRPGRQRG
jgi:hypothetical protein